MSDIVIRPLQTSDVDEIVDAFKELAWRDKTAAQYRGYVSEQESGRRDVLVARHVGKFAGYLTVHWQSLYPPFRRDQTPEVTDFNVLPHLRRPGILRLRAPRRL